MRTEPGTPQPEAAEVADSSEQATSPADGSDEFGLTSTRGRVPETIFSRPAEATRSGARIATIIGLLAFLGVFAFVLVEMRPDLIFGPGVDVGGDNGGHVAAPYFLIHYLLPKGRLEGWDSWWFDGFPLYVFYFPLPAFLVAVFSTVFSYAVAFKVVTALGTLTLPFVAYAFGRLGGFRRPVPVLMAAAMLPFLFNTSYTIDGGNIASTMAGEFSFSLAVSAGLLFLGVVAYALRTGRLRWLAAVLFAVTCVCHVVPALAFGASAAILSVATLRPSTLRSSLKVIVPIGIVGGLLAAWWLLPFAADLQYSSSMNYSPVGGPHWLSTNFIPKDYLFVLLPAALGALGSIIARHRVAFVLTISAAGSVLAFRWLPSGLVYNARWLPFWFLFTALLAAYGLGELFRAMGRLVAPSGFVSAAMVIGTLGALVGSVFAGGLEGSGFLGFAVPASHIQVDGWVEWNYSGLQAKSGWPIFEDMVRLLDRAGKKYGCGRLQYEYISETNDPFGSTDTMMSLPMWTDGCMQTTDGIYYESSTTNPFHFLDVSEVSQNGEAPDPVAGLKYPGFNLPDGIRHLQLMGVRYFLAMSPPVEAAAAADPSLVRIGSAPGIPGPYNGQPVPDPHIVLYLIKDSSLVVPLTHLPVVESSAAGPWLDTTLKWYESEQYWPTLLARSGPASWPRARIGTLVPPARSVPIPKTTISDIRYGGSSISFHVSRTGEPTLVKIPYFPNWTASGATGPYEVSPNLMVVVPTSHTVTLTYGTSTADWAGKIASLVGVVGLGALITATPPPPAITDSPITPTSPSSPTSPPFPGVPPLAPAPETPAGENSLPDDDPDSDEDDAPPSLSIVLPAHNEAALLPDTLGHLSRELSARQLSYELLVVENGSTDETAEVASQLSEEISSVTLVRLPEADYGEALRTGFLLARGAIVVNFDVDYYDVAFLEAASDLLSSGSAAIVVASKRAKRSEDRRPLARRVLTAGFAICMRRLLGLKVSDAHGIKAFNRSALLPLVQETRSGGGLFDVEVACRAERAGLEIAELPVTVGEVRPARSSVLRRSVEGLLGLLKLRWVLGPTRPA